VLVRVRASSANPWDWHFIRGEPVLLRPAGMSGVRRPTVERVGNDVTVFEPGAEVYGFGCLAHHRQGGDRGRLAGFERGERVRREHH
jgi:NADPH:quinone reductase-like Zn-dependent oxidoreductase